MVCKNVVREHKLSLIFAGKANKQRTLKKIKIYLLFYCIQQSAQCLDKHSTVVMTQQFH